MFRNKCVQLVLFCFILALVYFLTSNFFVSTEDIKLVDRRIDNTYRLILNGYAGPLFNFMYVGNIVWLAPVLSILYVYDIKKQKNRLPSEFLFLVSVLFFSLCIIGAKGYFNERYQLTVLPLLICLVWILLTRLNRYIKSNFFIILIASTFFNFGYYFFGFFAKKYLKNIHEKVSVKNESIVQVNDCIEELLKNEQMYSGKILVAGVPEFYYYTDMKGVYYYPSTDQVFTANGPLSLKKWIITVSNEDKNCYSYIIVNDEIVRFSISFSNYLRSSFKLMFRDMTGKSVYRLINSK